MRYWYALVPIVLVALIVALIVAFSVWVIPEQPARKIVGYGRINR